jgi:Protein of unknown function (DUF4446)
MHLTIPILLYSASALGIIGLIWLIRLEVKLHRLLGGSNAKSLEQAVVALRTEVKEIAAFRSEMEKYLTSVEKRLKKSVQSIETVRFNPFKGDGFGGNQSFATAFLTEKGNGVIFSSLYGRDRVSVFSKPVNNHESTFELTEEEREVLTKAKEAVSQ